MHMIKTLNDLDVYRLSYTVAMEIFKMTREFPKEEKYSLTDQIIRSSRSIAATIAEGWGWRSYENEFKKFLIYAMGSLEETKTWLRFSLDCGYIKSEKFSDIGRQLDETGAKIFRLFENWKSR